MELQPRGADLTEAEWFLVGQKIVPNFGNQWKDFVTSDGMAWSVFAHKSNTDHLMIAYQISITGDIISYSADIERRELEVVTAAAIETMIPQELMDDLADQYAFGTAIPVGDDLAPLRKLITEFSVANDAN